MTHRVGIVGAGITGLATTHHLAKRGIESVTFEANDRPGGVIQSRRVDGRVLELGAQRTRLIPPVERLVDDLGLRGELLTAPGDLPLYVYYDGALRTVPLSVREAVTTGLLSWRGKLRALFEPFTGPPQGSETVSEFLSRAFGHEVSDRYFGLLYSSIYGSDPDKMYMEYSLGQALEAAGLDKGSVLLGVTKRLLGGRNAPPTCSFKDGLAKLPEALYAANADRISLGTSVSKIEAAGDGYELVAGGKRVAVDEVVLTTPADVAADLLETVDPDSSMALRELTYNPLAHVYVSAEVDRQGLGYQVHRAEPYRTLGVTWNDAMFDRDGVYTCFFGGANDREVLGWSDERLGQVAVSEFEAVMGEPAHVLDVHRWHRGMPAFDDSWTAIERIDPPEGVRLCTNYTARAGIPGRLREALQTAETLADRFET